MAQCFRNKFLISSFFNVQLINLSNHISMLLQYKFTFQTLSDYVVFYFDALAVNVLIVWCKEHFFQINGQHLVIKILCI